jgi:hypothetical protein
MEVSKRDAREQNLDDALALVWSQWTSVVDPNLLTEAALIDLLRIHCYQSLYGVWFSAYRNILEDLGRQAQQQTPLAAFALFFFAWSKDIAKRWQQRVADYQAERILNARSIPAIVGQQDARMLVQSDIAPPWPFAKEMIVSNEDTKRESVTSVTQVHTHGELQAVRIIAPYSGDLVPIWRTELRACKSCADLEGTRPEVWRRISPTGPPMHPNCRCWLEWVRWEG